MAKDVKDSGNAAHSVSNRKDAIEEAFQECYRLDTEIEAIVEREVKPLRQEKGEVKSKLAADFELSKKAFNLHYAHWKAGQQARQRGDDAMLSTLQELHDILPIGGQLDLVDAIGKADSAQKSGNGAGAQA